MDGGGKQVSSTTAVRLERIRFWLVAVAAVIVLPILPKILIMLVATQGVVAPATTATESGH